MKNRKLTVFIVIDIQLFLAFILLIFFAPSTLPVLGGPIVAGLIGNGMVYITGNVTYAWQKSVNYKPEMDKKGNE